VLADYKSASLQVAHPQKALFILLTTPKQSLNHISGFNMHLTQAQVWQAHTRKHQAPAHGKQR